jgi:hypothetical protein
VPLPRPPTLASPPMPFLRAPPSTFLPCCTVGTVRVTRIPQESFPAHGLLDVGTFEGTGEGRERESESAHARGGIGKYTVSKGSSDPNQSSGGKEGLRADFG